MVNERLTGPRGRGQRRSGHSYKAVIRQSASPRIDTPLDSCVSAGGFALGADMAADTNYRAGIKLQFKSEWASFAASFARFEYALKMAGYLKYDKLGVSAEAGWAGFAKDMGDAFFAECRIEPALAVLFVAPPRLLKVEKDQAVAWKKSRAVNGLADFFAVIGDVQRGLFHGDPRAHGERDGDLINAAQEALDMAFGFAARRTDVDKLVRFCAAFRFLP